MPLQLKKIKKGGGLCQLNDAGITVRTTCPQSLRERWNDRESNMRPLALTQPLITMPNEHHHSVHREVVEKEGDNNMRGKISGQMGSRIQTELKEDKRCSTREACSSMKTSYLWRTLR